MNKENVLFEEEQAYLKEGYLCIKNEAWDMAIEKFKKALDVNPGNIWARIELGKLYRNKLDFGNAEKEFREALTMTLNSEQKEQVCICLGGIYWLRGNYGIAMQELREALKINPCNKKLNKWIKNRECINGFRKEIAPYRVFFTWGMHYECNYRCSYCYAPKPEKLLFDEKNQNKALYLSLDEWIRIWDNIYGKYGSCRIRLDGGEPSMYPLFIELVAKVSRQHLLQINTNLSFDVSEFAKVASPEMVRIDASFHPEFSTIENFVDKIKVLNECGFKLVVSCVAYPPFLDKIKEYKEPFEKLHIPFITHPFSGEFNGKSYPRAYEIEEISKIYNLDEASRLVMGWRKGEKNITKGKFCRMGQSYGRIYPNGDVYRCCAEGGMFKIGNIAQNTFQLLDEAIECGSENCPCWKCMIVCEERRWAPLWLDEWELPFA
jgi:tetratricopeptide (TPR) repeat protein